MPPEFLLIGGRSGVGKTSVALAVHERLSYAGGRHAMIEGDYLDLAFPAVRDDGFAERNLAHLWRRYREAGYARLVFPRRPACCGRAGMIIDRTGWMG